MSADMGRRELLGRMTGLILILRLQGGFEAPAVCGNEAVIFLHLDNILACVFDTLQGRLVAEPAEPAQSLLVS
jgi:hypothetical protein